MCSEKHVLSGCAEVNLYPTHEEGVDEWVHSINELIPIEGWDGVQSEPTDAPGDRGEGDIVRCDPGHPVEVRERLEDEAARGNTVSQTGESRGKKKRTRGTKSTRTWR